MCAKTSADNDKEEDLLSRPDVSFKHPQLFLFPGESAQNEASLYHQKHMLMTLLASFFYSAHLPERLAPGCFDYIGHSHQLFHVCVILATHMQMEAILLDKNLRKEWILANSRTLSFPQIAGAILLCLIFSLSNIIYFSAALYRIPEPELHKKRNMIQTISFLCQTST